MDLSQLQFEINKLYDSNHKLELEDYNYLLHNTTLFKEMTATVFIYDHMLNNHIKPDHNTYKLINRLHSKTILENRNIFVKNDFKKKLNPRRRIHKIMKGYNYSDNYQNALVHLDKVKKYLLENPINMKINNRFKLAKNISKNCKISIRESRYIITNLKKTKFLKKNDNQNQNSITDYFQSKKK